jgi:hypothetical protein
VAYLAPYDFRLDELRDPGPDAKGIELSWLLGQMYAAPTDEKILLLDAFHEGVGQDRQWQPSSAALVRSLTGARSQVSGSVRVITSCDDRQTNLTAEDDEHGLFAHCVAAAFRGESDEIADGRLSDQELFLSLRKSMAEAAATRRGVQTPAIFYWAPPPDLSDEAIEALTRLLLLLRRDDPMDLKFETTYLAARAASPQQPYAPLMKALAFLKDSKRPQEAREYFDKALESHPDQVMANHGMAWLKFRTSTTKSHVQGFEYLHRAVANLPDPKDEYAQHLFEFSGRMVGFAAYGVQTIAPKDVPKLALYNAIKKHDGEHAAGSLASFLEGGRSAKEKAEEFERQKRARPTEAKRIELNKRNVIYYTPYNEARGTYEGFNFGLVEDTLGAQLQLE